MSDVSIPGPSDEVGDWLSRLEGSRRDDGMEHYDERCRLIRRKYRYEGSSLIRTRKYQMLWSNMETMKSAVYDKPPHAVVSRRFRDQDAVARVATEVMERAINFTFEAADFDTEFKMVRDDFLLYARGVARVYYEPEYETEDDSNEDIEDAEDISQGASLGAGAFGNGSPVNQGLYGHQGGSRGGLAGGIAIQGRAAGQPYGAAEPGGADVGWPDKDESGGEPGPGEPKLKFENVRIRFVQRSDFRHQTARTWGETQWVAFRAFMTRDQISKRFGDKIGKEIALDADPMGDDDDSRREGKSGSSSAVQKAAIWEIWDKAKKKVLWISPSWPDVLEEGPPYLELDGFYPCPRPAYGTLTTDSLVPVPDYVFYQDQAAEIDQLTARIGGLSDALKLVGFYPAGPQGEGSPEVEKAMQPGFENKLIAVQGFSQFLESSGGKGAPIIWIPVDQVISVLEGCIKLRQQLVEDVYQIIGISDIMRGATDPQETEGAQQLKAQYGGVRVRDRQNEIARFCRDISRLVGQVIAQYCSQQTIMEMTNVTLPTKMQQMMMQLMASARQMQIGPPPGNGGQQPMQAPMGGMGQPQQAAPPQAAPSPPGPTQEDVFGLLKNNLLRRFKVDIETDSTVSGDESQEKQDRQGFIEAVTKFMEAWGPMVMQKPELAPLAGQLLLFGVRAFRVGRELEDVIEETADKLSASGQAPKPPDPKAQAEQIKLQGTQIKSQAEIQKSQLDGQTAQQAAAAKMQGIQMDSQAKIMELRMKLQAAEQEHQHSMGEAQMAHGASMDKLALAQHKQQADAQAAAQKQQAAQMPKWPVDPSQKPGF